MAIDLEKVQKVCMVVIDGWGISAEKEGNAIYHAKTPVMDRLMQNHIALHASEHHVGSMEGVMGSSKVGHINIGAGRQVWQDMPVVQKMKKSGEFESHPGLVKVLEKAQKSGRCHLLGLVSDGGVHSHINHVFWLLEACKNKGVKDCYVHFFADGRDSKAKSACQYLEQLNKYMDEHQYGKIATLMGRCTAMDRDKNWEITNKAYRVLVEGLGEEVSAKELPAKITEMQKSITSDEHLTPLVIDKEGCIRDGDSIIFFNFRADRMNQLVSVFELRKPEGCRHLKDLSIFCMSRYDNQFPYDWMIPIIPRKNCLSEYISSKGIKQFHCAETEKFFHMTIFFNQKEQPHEGEDWITVPSLGNPYVEKPRMSVDGVAEKMLEAINSGKYHFVTCNFAAPDMIGHTGSFEATVIACAATDEVIGKLEQACNEKGFVLIVTSDHGNAEKMLEDGEPCPKHTFNKVPFCINGNYKFINHANPDELSLRDVAPTVLKVMNIGIPEEMNGIPLVQ